MSFSPPAAPFTRVPPAVFPVIMGAFGLGLAWRRWSETFVKSSAASDLILGAVMLVFLAALAAYLIKLSKRPGVLIDDLRVLPGRAGLAAASLCLALSAVTLLPFHEGAANVVLHAALLTHLGLAGTMVYVFVTGPVEQRQVTPVWHLSFVGFILLPLSAIPLGHLGVSQVIFMATVLAALFIYAVSLGQILRRDPPPPLRPLLAVHLAPVSLFGTVALMFGFPQIALGFASMATLVLAGLIVKARYLMAAGFSPLWGAFTFPLAAYCSLVLMLGGQGLGPLYGDVARVGGAILLCLATLFIGYIFVRVLQMWLRGTLAQKTNAATA